MRVSSEGKQSGITHNIKSKMTQWGMKLMQNPRVQGQLMKGFEWYQQGQERFKAITEKALASYGLPSKGSLQTLQQKLTSLRKEVDNIRYQIEDLPRPAPIHTEKAPVAPLTVSKAVATSVAKEMKSAQAMNKEVVVKAAKSVKPAPQKAVESAKTAKAAPVKGPAKRK